MENERNLGIQPIAELMDSKNLKSHDLVEASEVQLTHKMITKARKGRRLTRNVQTKILNAFNRATGKRLDLKDLFNY
ncbi:MAG: hypothetical protein GY750_19370 [Lentisphaerae bacterium]|nr:hypothetical protein [Lentisphaerota bacterium]MCP4103558.1 hypothetical protein [Lentisphaerota bacterium]